MPSGDLLRHACRLGLCVAGYVVAAVCHAPLLLLVAVAAATFLAAFSLAHDLSHGALGLGRRAREWTLAVAGQVQLISGHGMRVGHLHHHAHPGAPDDLEGAVIEGSLLAAIVALPRLWLATRLEWMRSRRWRWPAAETAVNAALIAAALASGHRAAIAYVATVLMLQLTAPLWAGRLSHHPPRWLLRAARWLAFLRSPAILSLAFHELHHARPKVPCQQLAEAG